MRDRCILCGQFIQVAYEEKLDSGKVSDFTYASRKIPELMHYEYRECKDCQILQSSTIPPEGELLTAYFDAAFDSATESQYAAYTYADTLRHFIQPDVRLLDVGCGDGSFLAECVSRGVQEFRGIEPSPAAANLASDAICSRIFLGGHESFDTQEEFDLITLFQTIEHIRDPLAFFESMKRFAAPKALLAVACHDYRSPANRFLGERSPIFDIEHLQVFSQRSIAKALEAAGLEVVSVKAYANTYPMSYWLRLAPLPISWKKSGVAMHSRLAQTKVRLPVGNIMAIGRFSR